MLTGRRVASIAASSTSCNRSVSSCLLSVTSRYPKSDTQRDAEITCQHRPFSSRSFYANATGRTTAPSAPSMTRPPAVSTMTWSAPIRAAPSSTAGSPAHSAACPTPTTAACLRKYSPAGPQTNSSSLRHQAPIRVPRSVARSQIRRRQDSQARQSSSARISKKPSLASMYRSTSLVSRGRPCTASSRNPSTRYAVVDSSSLP